MSDDKAQSPDATAEPDKPDRQTGEAAPPSPPDAPDQAGVSAPTQGRPDSPTPTFRPEGLKQVWPSALVMFALALGLYAVSIMDVTGTRLPIDQEALRGFAPASQVIALFCVAMALTLIGSFALGFNAQFDWKTKKFGDATFQAGGAAAIFVVFLAGIFFLIERVTNDAERKQIAQLTDRVTALTSAKEALEGANAEAEASVEVYKAALGVLDGLNRFVLGDEELGRFQFSMQIFCDDDWYKLPDSRSPVSEIVAADNERFLGESGHHLLEMAIRRGSQADVYLRRSSALQSVGGRREFDAVVSFDLTGLGEGERPLINAFFKRGFAPCRDILGDPPAEAAVIDGGAQIGVKF